MLIGARDPMVLPIPVFRYFDFDIILTHLSALASTNAVSTAPCRVVYIYITLIGGSRGDCAMTML